MSGDLLLATPRGPLAKTMRLMKIDGWLRANPDGAACALLVLGILFALVATTGLSSIAAANAFMVGCYCAIQAYPRFPGKRGAFAALVAVACLASAIGIGYASP